MDVVEYFKIKKRVCASAGTGCCECMIANEPEDCICFELEYPEEAISAMEQWAEEHPQKTRQGEFLKMFPNAPLDRSSIVELCPKATEGVGYCNRGISMECVVCRREYWGKEIENEPLD